MSQEIKVKIPQLLDQNISARISATSQGVPIAIKSGGMAKVYSDETLVGDGTINAPLGINPEYTQRISDTISVVSDALAKEVENRISGDKELEEKIKLSIPEIVGIGTISTIKEENVVTISQTTYIHEQGIASDRWEIEHNLNRFPSVTVIDTSGVEVDCEVTYTDKNNCILTMNAPFKGKAYLN